MLESLLTIIIVDCRLIVLAKRKKKTILQEISYKCSVGSFFEQKRFLFLSLATLSAGICQNEVVSTKLQRQVHLHHLLRPV